MSDPNAWLNQLFSGRYSASGVQVDERSALTYSPQWAATRVLAETIAMLPIYLYRRKERGKERATDHPTYRIVHLRPNENQTAYDWKLTSAFHQLMYGYSVSRKLTDRLGKVLGLTLMMPWDVRVGETISGARYFEETRKDKKILYTAEQVLYLPVLELDGLTPASLITQFREAIGLGMAAEEYGARFYGNDCRPGGIITIQGRLQRDAKQRMVESWESGHQSLDKKHKTAVLEDGAKYTAIDVPPNAAQFLETRKYQVSETARNNRVPPHLIGDLEHATFTNIEQQSLEFVKYTMAPHITRWEQQLTTQLLTPKEQEEYFFEFSFDSLVRGDLESRYRAYSTAFQNGWMSLNEIREKENMNPIDGGDEYYRPSNLQNINEAPPEPVDIANAPIVDLTGEPDQKRAMETRARKISKKRAKIIGAHRAGFIIAAQKLVAMDADGIRSLIRSHLTRRDRQMFDEAQRKRYEELKAQIMKRMAPYYEAVRQSIEAEIEGELDRSITADELDAFVKKYVEGYARRFVGRSDALVKKWLNRDTWTEDIDALIDEYQEKTAGKDATWETVRAGNALARAAYIALGILTFMWASNSDSCPFCNSMDGKRVGGRDMFVGKGVSMHWGDGDYQPTHDIRHPPLHGGCQCQIIAG